MRCLLFIVASLAIFAHISCDWTPVDWTTLPAAKPNDRVDIYYLTAPLLEDEFGSLGKELNLYHGGLGLSNRDSGLNITLNYDAEDFFRASLFPSIVTLSNGSKALNWDNGGATFIYMGINTTYFKGINLSATTNGSVYNDFISTWNPKVNETQPFYNMFGVTSHYQGIIWLQSWDCFDYSWAAFQAFADRGVVFGSSISASRNFVNFYSWAQPKKVTEEYYNNQTVRADIINFYELTEAAWSKLSWTELFFTIMETLDGNFYLRMSDDYYHLSLRYPYVGFHFDPSPLPTASPSSAVSNKQSFGDSRVPVRLS
jgi:hypothetical protein